MKNLLDNIIMSNAYCEITDCRDIESCEKCVALNIAEHDKQIRAEAIDEYMNRLCDKCIQTPNECWNLECPFADDECQIIKIAEQLKEQNK